MSESVNHAVKMAVHGWNRELRWLLAICLMVIVLVAGFLFHTFSDPKTPGVTDKEIRIGSNMILSGSTAGIGRDYLAGLTAAIEKTNRAGGVHGRKITLIVRDNGYDPLRSVLNTRDLIVKDSVFALTSYVGTPTSVKAQAIWTGANVPVVGFYTGARALREPFNRYNFHLRASYCDEMHAAVNLFHDNLKLKRIAIFYQYDSFGQSVLKDARRLLEEHGSPPVAEGSYPRNTLEIESGLKAVLDAKPDGIILIGVYAPLAKFVKAVKASTKTPIAFSASSFAGPELFARALGKDGEGIYVCQVMPLYKNSTLPIVRDFLRDLHEISPGTEPSFCSLEGYINGRAVVEALNRSGRRLTREKFISAMESLRGEIWGPGFELSFGPHNHEGYNHAYTCILREGEFVYVESTN